ncbi:MAG: hypothetical protein H0W64_01250 [Gammaproteobacteria bacterium]|nr:hypothetical protein [Gammaproteobacteria bacterium]
MPFNKLNAKVQNANYYKDKIFYDYLGERLAEESNFKSILNIVQDAALRFEINRDPDVFLNFRANQAIIKGLAYLNMNRELENLVRMDAFWQRIGGAASAVWGHMAAGHLLYKDSVLKTLADFDNDQFRKVVAKSIINIRKQSNQSEVTLRIAPTNSHLLQQANEIHHIMVAYNRTFNDSKDAGKIAYKLKEFTRTSGVFHTELHQDKRGEALATQCSAANSKEALQQVLANERNRFFASPKNKDKKYVAVLEKQLIKLSR